MNHSYPPGAPDAGARAKHQGFARARMPWFAAVLIVLTVCPLLTGCFGFLKPAQSTARHFVLTPIPATEQVSADSVPVAVGVGQVKLPAYLFNTSLAIRKGVNEIQYDHAALWAERIDAAFQRVLAANLAILLPTERIHLSAWQRDDVTAELYVVIEQFDVDAAGRGVLIARWRLLSPGGEKVVKAGVSRLSRQGPSPEAGAEGMVATLSDLVADFSRQLAQALQEATAARHAVSAHGEPAK